MKKLGILVLVLAIIAAIVLFVILGGDGDVDGNDYLEDGEVVEEVNIGMLAPLTGNVAQFGLAVERGAMLYIDQFNAQGGLQINVNLIDEEGDVTLAVAGYERLVGQGVTAILGSVTSQPTMAIVPRAFADNMPMITATATHENVTVSADDGRVFTNMFRSCFIDPLQGERMAHFAAEVLEAQTAAILFSNEIDYSIGLRESFEARATQLGIEIVAVEIFPNETMEFRAQLTNIAQANPDVLFVPAYHQHVALIGPQSVDVGLDTIFLGPDGWARTLEFMEDASSIEGAFYASGFSPDTTDPVARQFIEDYMALHGVVPDMFAAQAYDAAKILVAAIVATVENTNYRPGSNAFRTALIANMAATDIVGVTGRITFDQFNNPQKPVVVLQIVDGRAVYRATI